MLESSAIIVTIWMLGLAWACGINAYATGLLLGLSAVTGFIELPVALAFLAYPATLGAMLALYALEFMVDKIPGVDRRWDALQTLVRIPMGALFAAAVLGTASSAALLAAAALGAIVAAATHVTKASLRLALHSITARWSVSLLEDAFVISGVLALLLAPIWFGAGLALFLAGIIWALPKLAPYTAALIRPFGFAFGLTARRSSHFRPRFAYPML